jgi:hypothetical protein
MEAYGTTNRRYALKEGKRLLNNPKISCRIEYGAGFTLEKKSVDAHWITERVVKLVQICMGEEVHPLTGQKVFYPTYALQGLTLLSKFKTFGLTSEAAQDPNSKYVIVVPNDDSGGDVEQWAKTHRRMDS